MNLSLYRVVHSRLSVKMIFRQEITLLCRSAKNIKTVNRNALPPMPYLKIRFCLASTHLSLDWLKLGWLTDHLGLQFIFSGHSLLNWVQTGTNEFSRSKLQANKPANFWVFRLWDSSRVYIRQASFHLETRFLSFKQHNKHNLPLPATFSTFSPFYPQHNTTQYNHNTLSKPHTSWLPMVLSSLKPPTCPWCCVDIWSIFKRSETISTSSAIIIRRKHNRLACRMQSLNMSTSNSPRWSQSSSKMRSARSVESPLSSLDLFTKTSQIPLPRRSGTSWLIKSIISSYLLFFRIHFLVVWAHANCVFMS